MTRFAKFLGQAFFAATVLSVISLMVMGVIYVGVNFFG